jgi:PAS domain S-box-containing protein
LALVHQLLRGEIDWYQMEKRYVRRDGRVVWVQLTASVVRDDDGTPIHFIAQVQDISRRRQADDELRGSEERSRLSEARLQAFMNNSPSVMFIKDLDGRYVHVNERFTLAFGLQRGAIIARTDAEIFAPEQAAQFHENDASVIAAGAPIEVEENAQYSDGLHTGLVCKFPIFDSSGRTTAIGGIVTDITSRKQAEREIRKLNDDLRYQTAELIATNREIEAFSYSVAHDLRAPLRHVLGFSKILTEEYGGQLNAEANRYLDKVQDGARYMGRLVDALLGLAKVGRQALVPQVMPLGAILNTILERLEPEHSGRNIDWQIGELFSVECDPELMKQVFANLLSNALKYTRPRDRAVIAVGQTVIDGQPVVFVRDNGVGFDMRHAGKLFGVFERLHKARDFEGTGVGLATVERIIRRHGGSIWADAQPDRGATFFFTVGAIMESERRTGFVELTG